MSKIANMNDLVSVVMNKWRELDDIPSNYLNAEGLAAKEAYRSIIWYTGFHDTLESFSEDEGFIGLLSIPGKNPEYYRILRQVNRAIEKSINSGIK